MVDEDRVEGAAKNIGGKIKEGVGKAVGDEKLRREGQLDQVKGRAENAIGSPAEVLLKVLSYLVPAQNAHFRREHRTDDALV